MLALLVQLAAPIGAALAATARGGLPADVPICSEHQPKDSPERRDPGDTATCTLCQMCCAAAQPLLPGAVLPEPPPPMAVPIAPVHRPGVPHGFAADRPNARAPPSC